MSSPMVCFSVYKISLIFASQSLIQQLCYVKCNKSKCGSIYLYERTESFKSVKKKIVPCDLVSAWIARQNFCWRGSISNSTKCTFVSNTTTTTLLRLTTGMFTRASLHTLCQMHIWIQPFIRTHAYLNTTIGAEDKHRKWTGRRWRALCIALGLNYSREIIMKIQMANYYNRLISSNVLN